MKPIPSVEVIWKFTCEVCGQWWSYSTDPRWRPEKMWCPHCGRLNEWLHFKHASDKIKEGVDSTNKT